MSHFVSANQVASVLGVSRVKVIRMAKAGKIPGSVLAGSRYRFNAERIAEWLKIPIEKINADT
jgi:excisionase family DNA binding protein